MYYETVETLEEMTSSSIDALVPSELPAAMDDMKLSDPLSANRRPFVDCHFRLVRSLACARRRRMVRTPMTTATVARMARTAARAAASTTDDVVRPLAAPEDDPAPADWALARVATEREQRTAHWYSC